MNYFDHNATAPIWDAAKDAWNQASDRYWQNPSSPYRAAAKVRIQLELARESMAELLELSPERIVFTSGGTEANNSIFRYWAEHFPKVAENRQKGKSTSLGFEGVVGLNPTEHPSVSDSVKHHSGLKLELLEINSDGTLNLNALEAQFKKNAFQAISVMAANNETGILNDWEKIAALAKHYSVQFHCDASQWFGRLSPRGFGACDFVTGCAHKFGGPKGVGFVVIPQGARGFNIRHGGDQEAGHRAGTEDFPSISAMLKALILSEQKRVAEGFFEMSRSLRAEFIQGIKKVVPEVLIVGESAPCLWNTVGMIVPHFLSEQWVSELEKKGYFISTGSACSTGLNKTSSVLNAMGFSTMEAKRFIRISSGLETSAENWRGLLEAMSQVHSELSLTQDEGQTIIIDP
tara:strand:- start:151 stop:1362 length:1212 start_codon:yes stop_codon:yes gene_type:complete